MINRDEFLKQIKKESIGTVSELSSSDERFQNQTLRPILKFQNDLLIAVFVEYCLKQKNVFSNLSLNKKLDYIEQSIQRDMKFRDFLKGIIIGLFDSEEFVIYSQNASNLNKRLISMLIERLKSQIQIIESSFLE